MNWGIFYILHFLKDNLGSIGSSSSSIFGRIPLWSHLIPDFFFLLEVFFHYWFNFNASSQSVQITCFFPMKYWKSFSKNLSVSSKLSNRLVYKLWLSLMIICISVISVVISPFHFFGTSLFSSWWAWLKAYQFYLFKNQLLVSWSFLFF